MHDTPHGFSLTLTDEQGHSATVDCVRDKELARTEQRAGIEAQLSKLGGTIFVANKIDVDFTDNWFIPSSVVADMRRTAVEKLCKLTMDNGQWTIENASAEHSNLHEANSKLKIKGGNKGAATHLDVNCELSTVNGQFRLSYLANVANHRAAEFYRARGAEEVAPAYELNAPRRATLMFCRHCLRYAMGWCPHCGGKPSPYREPYTLVSADGKRITLAFDCKACVMLVR